MSAESLPAAEAAAAGDKESHISKDMACPKEDGMLDGTGDAWRTVLATCSSLAAYLFVVLNVCRFAKGDAALAAKYADEVPRVTYLVPCLAFCVAFLLNLLTLAVDHHTTKFRLTLIVCYINLLAAFNDFLSFSRASPVFKDPWGHGLQLNRLVMWLFTTPAMVYLLAVISDFTPKQVADAVMCDAGMVAILILALIQRSQIVAVVLITTSVVLFYHTMKAVWHMFSGPIATINNRGAKLSLSIIRIATLVTWSCFIIIFVVTKLNLVSLGTEEWLWGIMDYLGKVMFSSSLLQGNFVTMDERRLAVIRSLEESSRQQVIAELKALVKQKEQFISSISHELRTPLNGIIGLSDALMVGCCGQLAEPASKTIATIKSSGARLLTLINDILDAAAMQSGQLVMRHERVQLDKLVDDIINLSKPLVRKGVQLTGEIPADLPPVQGDAGRLQQVLSNLVGNACKFTHTGTITVSASLKQDKVEVAVTDTGIGIPPDKFGSIFQAFEQVDMSTTRKYGGTGLGLNLVKQLVEAHGGTISLNSKINGGTTFFFTLKLWETPEPPEPEVLSEPAGPAGLEPARRRAKRVLSMLRVAPRDGPAGPGSPFAQSPRHLHHHPHRASSDIRMSRELRTSRSVKSELRGQHHATRGQSVADSTDGQRETIAPETPRNAFAGPNSSPLPLLFTDEEIQPIATSPSVIQIGGAPGDGGEPSNAGLKQADQPVTGSTIGRGPSSAAYEASAHQAAAPGLDNQAALPGLPRQAGRSRLSTDRPTRASTATVGMQEVEEEGGEVGEEEEGLMEQQPDGKPVHVLSVDDDPVNQMVLENLLAPEGFKITQAMDGTAALELLQGMSELPDIILLDVMMPGMSGYEVCRTLRGLYPESCVPVIMVSAKTKEEDIVEGLAMGANDYVVKPFGRKEILARIKAHLRYRNNVISAAAGTPGSDAVLDGSPDKQAAQMVETWAELLCGNNSVQYSLPPSVKSQVENRAGGAPTLQVFEELTMVVVGFANLGALTVRTPLPQLLGCLTSLHILLEELLAQYSAYLVDCLEDQLVVLVGLGGEPQLEQVRKALALARELQQLAASTMEATASRLLLSIGLHSCPATAVIAGVTHPVLQVTGVLPDKATQLQATCPPGCIHVSRRVYELSGRYSEFVVGLQMPNIQDNTYLHTTGPWSAHQEGMPARYDRPRRKHRGSKRGRRSPGDSLAPSRAATNTMLTVLSSAEEAGQHPATRAHSLGTARRTHEHGSEQPEASASASARETADNSLPGFIAQDLMDTVISLQQGLAERSASPRAVTRTPPRYSSSGSMAGSLRLGGELRRGMSAEVQPRGRRSEAEAQQRERGQDAPDSALQLVARLQLEKEVLQHRLETKQTEVDTLQVLVDNLRLDLYGLDSLQVKLEHSSKELDDAHAAITLLKQQMAAASAVSSRTATQSGYLLQSPSTAPSHPGVSLASAEGLCPQNLEGHSTDASAGMRSGANSALARPNVPSMEAFLADLSLSHLAAVFAREEVTPEMLPYISNDELAQLGVLRPEDRDQLRLAAQSLL